MTEVEELLKQLPMALEGAGIIVLVLLVMAWMALPLKKEGPIEKNVSPDRDGGE